MNTFRAKSLLVILLWLFGANTSFAQNVPVLNLNTENIEIKSTEWLLSKNDEVTIPHSGKFTPATKEVNFGLDTSVLWLKVIVFNPTHLEQKAVFSSDQVILEDVRFYKKTAGKWTQEKSGWGIPVAQKSYPYTFHSFDFTLKPLQTDTFFFRVKNQYQVLKLPLTAFTPSAHIHHTHQYLLLDGMVTMALITAILYCLYNLLFSGKDHRTLWSYLLYAVNFLLFFTIRISGPNFVSEAINPLVNYYVNILIFISTYTFFRFGILFIDPDRKWLNKSILLIINILFIITIFISIPPTWSNIPVLIIIKEAFFIFTIAYLIFYLLRSFRHSVIARVYFFMAMPLIVSGLLEGLTNTFGLFSLPSSFFSAFRVAICVEMLYIFFALIFRERELNRNIQGKLVQSELALLNAEINAQENERRRIAGDLHDDLGGTLSTLKRMILDQLEPITQSKALSPIRTLMEKAAGDLRRITHDLMPTDFERTRLSDAVMALVNFNNQPERPAEFILSGNYIPLKKETEIQIYRIISEAIQNINKHSEAKSFTVQLIYSTDELTVMIEDNGKGFSENVQKAGLGLKNMQLRAQKSGAIITFDSNPNGTTVILEQPINEVADSDS
ncbi:MAG: hypothetical protein IPP05_14025 [Cytophagaceae bacterium]|nr:hypothetical protein [Cytophagaceae bacterium]MBL0301658.1 hypothetical protein [Cytophagaceae bacterium]